MSARHVHTDVVPDGSANSSMIAKHRLWDLTLRTPKWAPPVVRPPKTSPAVVVSLELRTAKALARLRQRLSELIREETGPQAKIRALTVSRVPFKPTRPHPCQLELQHATQVAC